MSDWGRSMANDGSHRSDDDASTKRHGRITCAPQRVGTPTPMQPRILIVEDEHDLGQALVYYLKNEGFHAELETTAAGGLRAMSHEDLPDLVLIDWMLPDSPGTELCRQLKSADRTRRVPIVMISARGEEIDRVVGFEL